MKLGEQFVDGEGSTFHVKTTYDLDPTFKKAEMLRHAGADKFGDSRLVGTIPGWLVTEWMKEAGVSYNDPDAENKRNEIVRQKMLSGEFSKLRIWEGSY